MIRDTILAFDDRVIVGAPARTSDNHAERLGINDKLALQLVVDDVKGAGAGTVTVACEHSGDGENWIAKGPGPEIDAFVVTPGSAAFDEGYVYDKPSLPFVRFSIALAGLVTSAHVKLYVTARDPSG